MPVSIGIVRLEAGFGNGGKSNLLAYLVHSTMATAHQASWVSILFQVPLSWPRITVSMASITSTNTASNSAPSSSTLQRQVGGHQWQFHPQDLEFSIQIA